MTTAYSTMKHGKLKKEVEKLAKAAQAAEKEVETAEKTCATKRKKLDKKLEKLGEAKTDRAKVAASLAQAEEALAKLETKSEVEETKPEVEVEETGVAPGAASAKPSKRESSSPLTNGKRQKQTATSAPVQKEDLTLVEGIGPKLAEVLNEAGITSLAHLARRKPAGLRKILVAKDSAYQAHNPETWPAQAALAGKGKLDELKALQAKLKAGRPAG